MTQSKQTRGTYVFALLHARRSARHFLSCLLLLVLLLFFKTTCVENCMSKFFAASTRIGLRFSEQHQMNSEAGMSPSGL